MNKLLENESELSIFLFKKFNNTENKLRYDFDLLLSQNTYIS